MMGDSIAHPEVKDICIKVEHFQTTVRPLKGTVRAVSEINARCETIKALLVEIDARLA